METNEVMANEELMVNLEETAGTTAEETEQEVSGNGFKMAVCFGVAFIAGMAAGKLAKPVIAKIKARKKPEKVVDTEGVVMDDCDVPEDDRPEQDESC